MPGNAVAAGRLNRIRWAVVVTLALVLVAWLGRYRAIECHTEFRGSTRGSRLDPVWDGGQGKAVGGGCYVLDRWTGRVRFREAAFEAAP